MERKIDKFLQKWKIDVTRKPLIIYGPRQIGKTYSVLEFGNKEYKNVVYFNTNNNKTIKELFIKEKSTEKIVLNLSLLSGETILKEDTLIIFDNIKDIEITKGLKLFGSEHSKYHIIGILAKKEKLSEIIGEELQFKNMNEMDFEEYLWAHNEKSLSELIKESFTKRKTCPFHKTALELFQNYIVTGGLPEVIDAELAGKSEYVLDSIKQKLLDIYLKEITGAKNLIDIPRGIEVIESLPDQLQKENKKFQYGIIGPGKRAKEYDSSINFLVNSQLVCRSYKVKDIKSPLSSQKDNESFKLYSIDDGILYTMYHLNYKQFISNENIKEILYENHIAKTLSSNGFSLYYYQSDGKAEVNFVVQNRKGQIIPIELTTKTNSKAKSLSVFMKKFIVPEGYRITENNFQTKKSIRYIPIYATFCFDNLSI